MSRRLLTMLMLLVLAPLSLWFALSQGSLDIGAQEMWLVLRGNTDNAMSYRGHTRTAPATRVVGLRRRRTARAFGRPAASAVAQSARGPLCARHFGWRGRRRVAVHARRARHRLGTRQCLPRRAAVHAHRLWIESPGLRLDAEPAAAYRRGGRGRLGRVDQPDTDAGAQRAGPWHAVLAARRPESRHATAMALAALAVGLAVSLWFARALNLLMRGENTAAALGENPARLRLHHLPGCLAADGHGGHARRQRGFRGPGDSPYIKVAGRLGSPLSAAGLRAARRRFPDDCRYPRAQLGGPRATARRRHHRLAGCSGISLSPDPLTLMLRAQNLTLTIAERILCDNLNVSLEAGENWVMLGANGSGKTTLLHALAGLRAPDSGHVSLDDGEIGGIPARTRAPASGRAVSGRGVGISRHASSKRY